MRRRRWRLAALISGSTATALRALVSHAQAAFARCRRSLFAVIGYSPTAMIYPLPLYCNSMRSTQSCFLRVLSEASGAGADYSVCYYAAHDTRGSNLRIAEAAG